VAGIFYVVLALFWLGLYLLCFSREFPKRVFFWKLRQHISERGFLGRLLEESAWIKFPDGFLEESYPRELSNIDVK